MFKGLERGLNLNNQRKGPVSRLASLARVPASFNMDDPEVNYPGLSTHHLYETEEWTEGMDYLYSRP